MIRFEVGDNAALTGAVQYGRKRPMAAALSVAGVLCLVALPAHANAGTGFMMVFAIYVLFANILIGLFEGGIVKLVFRDCKLIIILPLFVAANYASLFAGMMLLGWIRNGLAAYASPGLLVFQAPKIIAMLASAAYVITILAEWPFCWFAIRKRPRAWTKALALSLALQTLSYIPVTAWWSRLSSYDMYLNCALVESTSFTKNPGFTVYTLDDEALWKQNLDGSARTRLADAPKDARVYWLFMQEDGGLAKIIATGHALKADGSTDEVSSEPVAEIPLDDGARATIASPLFNRGQHLRWQADERGAFDPWDMVYHWVGIDYRLPDIHSRTVGTLAQAGAYLVVPDENHAKTLLPALAKEREAEAQEERPQRL